MWLEDFKVPPKHVNPTQDSMKNVIWIHENGHIWKIENNSNLSHTIVFKFLKIFPKMGFSLLMTQMKSKNFNFDRVWTMSIVKYIFFSISTEKWQKKIVQQFFIQSAAAAVLKFF